MCAYIFSVWMSGNGQKCNNPKEVFISLVSVITVSRKKTKTKQQQKKKTSGFLKINNYINR